jgi:hypothetical protein
VEPAFLIVGLTLVLMAFAPVAPRDAPRVGLGTRIARQLRLWDRYLLNPPGGDTWCR